jgi:hypothetical protein
MKTQKMSLAAVRGKLSREEMKKAKGASLSGGFGCGSGGDVCGVINGVEYTCCTSDRIRKCVNGYCDEP